MLQIPFDAVPISDGIIRLRSFVAADAPRIAAACQDPEIPRWTFMPEGLDVDGALEWIRRGEQLYAERTNVSFAIEECDGELVGQIGTGHLDWLNLTGEIYYWLAAEARGRGYATRALRLVTRWDFDTLGLQRVYLFADPQNAASQAVATRAGFQREGQLRSHQVFKGRRMDSVLFSKLPGDPE